MNSSNRIDNFVGAYSWLSNFWPAQVSMDGEQYTSVEHAYQAAKSLDRLERTRIRMALRSGQAKLLGKRITLRHDWSLVKLDTMWGLLIQKFNPTLNPVLYRKLQQTASRELIEGNHWHDNYWGRCRCPYCDKKEKLNWLGHMLMRIRDGETREQAFWRTAPQPPDAPPKGPQ